MEVIAGKTVNEWLVLFNMSHNLTESSFHQWCWPDGDTGIKQDHKLITVFNIIKTEALRQIQKKAKQKK